MPSQQDPGHLYRSTDGGFTFSGNPIDFGSFARAAFHNPYQLDPSDPDRIVYATQRLWHNVGGWDGTWAHLSTDSDLTDSGDAAVRSLAIAPGDNSVVYVATNNYTTASPREPNAKVLVSTDGGVNFTETGLTPHPGWRRITRELWVHPNDANTAYVARAAFDDPVGQVLRTGNAGGNFQSITGNTFPKIPTNVVALDVRDSAEVIYAGTDSGLYYSVNDGATWYHFTGMPNAIIIDIVVDQARDRLIIGTQGRGVWSVDIDVPMEFGSADFNQDKTIDELDVADFQTALAAGDVYAIDWDLTTGPAVGDLLDLAAFTDEWLAKKK